MNFYFKFDKTHNHVSTVNNNNTTTTPPLLITSTMILSNTILDCSQDQLHQMLDTTKPKTIDIEKYYKLKKRVKTAEQTVSELTTKFQEMENAIKELKKSQNEANTNIKNDINTTLANFEENIEKDVVSIIFRLNRLEDSKSEQEPQNESSAKQKKANDLYKKLNTAYNTFKRDTKEDIEDIWYRLDKLEDSVCNQELHKAIEQSKEEQKGLDIMATQWFSKQTVNKEWRGIDGLCMRYNRDYYNKQNDMDINEIMYLGNIIISGSFKYVRIENSTIFEYSMNTLVNILKKNNYILEELWIECHMDKIAVEKLEKNKDLIKNLICNDGQDDIKGWSEQESNIRFEEENEGVLVDTILIKRHTLNKNDGDNIDRNCINIHNIKVLDINNQHVPILTHEMSNNYNVGYVPFHTRHPDYNNWIKFYIEPSIIKSITILNRKDAWQDRIVGCKLSCAFGDTLVYDWPVISDQSKLTFLYEDSCNQM
jgi:uncharacterized protein YlxW (UPF0749 family)